MQAILKIRMLGVRGALLVALAAGMVLPIAQAQSSKPNQKSDNKASGSTQTQPASGSSKAAEKESASANKEHAGGAQEGIEVHGHWVIDVRNPDGKLVSHREFENAYQGPGFLLTILTRTNTMGLWGVVLDSASTQYEILEPNDPATPSGPVSKNLSIAVSTGVTLSGSITAPVTDIISDVRTNFGICGATIAPLNCAGTSVGRPFFTGTTLSPGISIVAGQIVQVTVTISFSAAPGS